mmetsp:Transcript_54327/g.151268  ORF Transcript_54327/g.151268 Transcript_54327/m.151268 type:complete len:252 (+) Transcript_54327:100-855(+)
MARHEIAGSEVGEGLGPSALPLPPSFFLVLRSFLGASGSTSSTSHSSCSVDFTFFLPLTATVSSSRASSSLFTMAFFFLGFFTSSSFGAADCSDLCSAFPGEDASSTRGASNWRGLSPIGFRLAAFVRIALRDGRVASSSAKLCGGVAAPSLIVNDDAVSCFSAGAAPPVPASASMSSPPFDLRAATFGRVVDLRGVRFASSPGAMVNAGGTLSSTVLQSIAKGAFACPAGAISSCTSSASFKLPFAPLPD